MKFHKKQKECKKYSKSNENILSILLSNEFEIHHLKLSLYKIDIFPRIHPSMNNMIKYVLIDKSINLKPIRKCKKLFHM